MTPRYRNSVFLFLLSLSGFATAAPQLQVERDPGGVISSGALVTYSNAMAGGVSEVLRVDEPQDPVNLAFQIVPPGVYQVQSTDFEEDFWSSISGNLSPVGGVIQYEDFPGPVEVVFYRLMTIEPESLSFTIRNTGDEDLVIGPLTLDGTHADFFWVDSTGLPFDGVLAPDESATVSVEFFPFEVGPAEAKLNIASNDPDLAVFEINLSGTGVLVVPGGGPTPDPDPLGFASPPSITPATATEPARFSATVTGPPNAAAVLEASRKLGELPDHPWVVIHSFDLNANGEALLNDIPHPGSEGFDTVFFRVRLP